MIIRTINAKEIINKINKNFRDLIPNFIAIIINIAATKEAKIKSIGEEKSFNVEPKIFISQ